MSQPYPQQGYPQGPQQPVQWPSQQPQYAPPPQQFQQPYGQPQGYPQGAQQFQQPQGPPQEFKQGNLDDFYSAPAVGGGGGLKFPVDGSWHIGIVNRALVDSDTEQQSDINDKTKPAFDGKGNPKWVLKIPLNVVVSQDNPEGVAKLFNQGAAREDLLRAMQIVGAPPGPPEPGSAIYVCKTGTRKAGNFKANTWEYRYWRPQDAVAIAQQQGIAYPDLSHAGQAQTLANEQQAVQPPQEQAPHPVQQQPVQQYQPAPGEAQHLANAQAMNQAANQAIQPQGQPVQQFQPPVQQYAPPQAQTPPPAQAPQQFQPPVQQAPPAQAPAQQPPPPPGDLASLPPEKQALFGQLTGQPQG